MMWGHNQDLFIREYADAGIPMLCRLEDFPKVSRLYAEGGEPTPDQLRAWYRTGHLVHQAATIVNGKPTHRKGRWVNVHQTLYLWKVHPASYYDIPHKR